MKGIVTTAIASLALLFCTQAVAKDKLIVWEDTGKAHGIEKAIKAFETQYNCDVEIHQSEYVEHINDQQKALSAGKPTPDVLMLPADRLGDAAKNGFIIPLDFMEKDKARYLPSAITSLSYNHQIYAMPRSVETLVIYYNQDLLKYPFENFDDYIKFSKEQKKEGRYGVIGKLDVFYFSYGFIGGYGAYIFKDVGNGKLDPNNLGLNNDGAVKGLEFLAKLVNTTLPKSILGNDGWGNLNKLFIEGKAAAIITGPWELDNFAKTNLNYGVAPLGKLPNGKYFSPLLSYRAYAVSSFSKNKELAKKFLQFINQSEYALNRYSEIHEIPPIVEIMNMPVIQNDDFANAVLTQALHATPMPTIPQMQAVWAPMDQALNDAISGKKSAKQALQDATDTIKNAINAQ